MDAPAEPKGETNGRGGPAVAPARVVPMSSPHEFEAVAAVALEARAYERLQLV